MTNDENPNSAHHIQRENSSFELGHFLDIRH
jgi:hypothetical protein